MVVASLKCFYRVLLLAVGVGVGGWCRCGALWGLVPWGALGRALQNLQTPLSQTSYPQMTLNMLRNLGQKLDYVVIIKKNVL